MKDKRQVFPYNESNYSCIRKCTKETINYSLFFYEISQTSTFLIKFTIDFPTMFMISNTPLTFTTYVLRLNPNTLDIQKT